ncbi:MAG: acyl carrier protein [Gammaproteobacteria bacterium]
MEMRIKSLFARILKTDESLVCDSTTPASLINWDSIQHMFLVSGFEEEFSIDIDPEEVVEMYRDYSTFKRVILSKMA